MPIDRIHIQNFKSIRNSGEIKIRPINVLIGPNGVGKSNFIGFFKLLNSIYEGRLKSYVANQGYAHKILHFGPKRSKFVGGKIAFKENSKANNRYIFQLVPTQDSGLAFEIERCGYNIFYRNGYSENWDDQDTGATGDSESKVKSNTGTRYAYLSSYFEEFRIFHFHDTSSNSSLKQPADLRDNAFLREDGRNLPAFLFRMKQQHPKSYLLIEHTIRSIAPFFDSFDLAPDFIDETQVFLNWKEKGSDAYFNAQNLSDGTLRFIALSALLLQPQPPRTIIIDEPELGLHPAAIHKLAAMIKSASSKAQIIVSTQSVNLLDQFDPEDVIVVDRADEQTVFRRLESEDYKEWLEEYSIGQLWSKNIIGGIP